MTPFYEHAGVTIFHGDAREILPQLGAESIITDPVWPNCGHIFPGINAAKLLNEVLSVARVRRAAIQLGCNSDPRFLAAVPKIFPYLRTCYLEYAIAGYLGRIMRDAEVAFIFGDAPDWKPGATVMPGRTIATRSNADKGWSNKGRTSIQVAASIERMAHPTKRLLQHVQWLCRWFGGASVIDPFMGSGTTALACKNLGIPFIGIEIEERYCELAVARLKQESFFLTEVPAAIPQAWGLQ